MKPTIPIVLMGAFVLILSAITVAVIFAVDQYNQWQDNQQIISAIQEGDETAIETLEHSGIETQLKILEGDHVKKSLVDFYLQTIDDDSLWTKLETYDDTVENNILKNDEVYQTLIAHYLAQINPAIENDNFDKAFSLLNVLKNKYPNSKELSAKYAELQEKKQQRLADLTRQYMECLDQTLEPLLERTHCMAESRRKIEYVGIEHTLPSDSNLPEMYVEEIEQTLIEKNYEHASKLLLDWQNSIPTSSEERDKLQNSLLIHQQIKSIITDLVGYDKEKIIARLYQLKTVPSLQEEVLAMPNIQNNLLRFHLSEALALMTENSMEVYMNPNTKSKLERIITIANGKLMIPVDFTNASIPMASSLKICQNHYKANRLTTGKQGSALVCYKKVLKKDPGNVDALLGLQAIEKRYKTWIEQALRRNKLNKADIYLTAIKKVNPKSRILRPLRRRLDAAILKTMHKSTHKSTRKSTQKKNLQCRGCDCSVLLRQLSMGIRPLTTKQKEFFQNQCR